MKEYGINLAPENFGMSPQTLIIPPSMQMLAETHLEPFDVKRHNTVVTIAELLPTRKEGDGMGDNTKIPIVINPKTYYETQEGGNAK